MLSNGTLTLRAPEPADLDFLYKQENDTTYWHLGETRIPFSRDLLSHYIDSAQQDIYVSRQARFMIESEGAVIGMVDLYDFEPLHRKAGVGIMLDSKQRGKGLGKQALDLLCDYAFDHLNLNMLYAYVTVDNAASVGLFESCAFAKACTLQQWSFQQGTFKDQFIFQRLQNP